MRNVRLMSSPSGTKNVYDLVANLVTDYGADPTGVVQIGATALPAATAAMQNKNTFLRIPNGTYTWTTLGATWLNGVKNITIDATGASLSGSGMGLQTRHIQQAGIDSTTGGADGTGGKSARIQSVSAGATSVTLTSASAAAGHISRFSVGQCILITGWSIQGFWQRPFSFPPNWAFSDFVTITSIVGNTVSFTPALTNSYDQNWPEINRGDNNETDAAGPASIIGLDPYWKGTTTVLNGYWDRPDLINCYRENFIVTGAVCPTLPMYPSVTKLYRAVNCTATGALTEHDKLCDTVDIQGGTYSSWKCQSGTTRILTMNGVTLTPGGLDGSVGDTTLDNCSVAGNVVCGPIAYGRANKLTIRNSLVTGTVGSGYVETGPGGETSIQNYVKKSGAVLTIPLAMNDNLTRWSMPDATGRNVLWWEGSSGTMGYFRVLSATSDSWPAVDNQTSTTNVSITSGSKSLTVSSSIFSSGDVGKCILIPGAGSSGATLRTWITAYSSATSVTLYTAAGSTLSASSRSLQWGTCNTYLTTDTTDAIPAGATRIRVPGVRSIRFENVTGTEQVVDLSQAAAQDKPIFSYTKRTYTSLPTTNITPITMHGSLVSLKVNVTKIYTGAQGTLTAGLGQFGFGVYSSGSYSTWNPRFNVKVLGERVITVGSTTGTQTGDSNLTLSNPTWMTGSFNPVLSASISGESSSVWPEFTIEMITDQGWP